MLANAASADTPVTTRGIALIGSGFYLAVPISQHGNRSRTPHIVTPTGEEAPPNGPLAYDFYRGGYLDTPGRHTLWFGYRQCPALNAHEDTATTPPGANAGSRVLG